MANANPPKKNQAFAYRAGLKDTSIAYSLKINPTLTTGDWKVDIDGGGFNNLATLPTVSPAASAAVLISLSATEMNGDVITVKGVDSASPKTYVDYFLCILTTA